MAYLTVQQTLPAFRVLVLGFLDATQFVFCGGVCHLNVPVPTHSFVPVFLLSIMLDPSVFPWSLLSHGIFIVSLS